MTSIAVKNNIFSAFAAMAISGISFFSISIFPHLQYHDTQRILQIIVLVIGVLVMTRRLWSGCRMGVKMDHSLFLMLWLFFAVGMASSLLAWSPHKAFYEWANFGLLLVFAWVIAGDMMVDPRGSLDVILTISGFGCALYLLASFAVYFSALLNGTQPDSSDLIPGFDNYRFFNHVQTITLPLLGLHVLRQNQSVKFSKYVAIKNQIENNQVIFWWVVLSAWWMLLFFSAGRGTFVGVVAGLIMVLFWRRRQAWSWCRVMLLSAVAGLVAYFLFYTIIPIQFGLQPFDFLRHVSDRTMVNPDSSRIPLWTLAIKMVMLHPWLGAGPLHFAHHGRELNIAAHPHNWFLQIIAEWGVLAFVCLLGALLIALRRLIAVTRLITKEDSANQAIGTAFLATFVAISTDGLVSGLIVIPTSQLWIALYAGCAWGWVASISAEGNKHRIQFSNLIRIASGGCLFLFLGLFLYGVSKEVSYLKVPDISVLRDDVEIPRRKLSPRLWVDGYF